MTQQPVYPGQQPGYPQQYPQQVQQPMQQGYPAQPFQQPGYPPQGYGQPQQAPAPPPAVAGTLDDYYNQAVAAGGPGISWKDKPIGTTYAGVIGAKPNVQQDTDFNTKMPMFQKDGVTPKWVMLIPLVQVGSNFQTFNGQPEFPDGEVVYYARGKDKEELNRAMAEAGCSGAPQVGATFQVTLVQRKPNRTGNPTNVVQIRYTPPDGVPHQAQQQAAPATQVAGVPQQLSAPQAVQPQAPAQPQVTYQQPGVQYQQPVAPQLGGFVQSVQGPGVVQQEQPPTWAQPAPVQQPQLAQQVQQPVAPQAPAPQPPAGMTPEASAILAGLTGQQG